VEGPLPLAVPGLAPLFSSRVHRLRPEPVHDPVAVRIDAQGFGDLGLERGEHRYTERRSCGDLIWNG
jgi:hypothetical protein